MVVRAHKVRISCGVLGVSNGSVISLKIACNATVAKLRASAMIKLYVTEDPYVGDARLIDDANAEPFLKHGRVPESGFKVMIPMWMLNSANCFGSAFSIRDKELHVLVELSNTEAPAKC